MHTLPNQSKSATLGEKKSGHLGKMSELNKTVFILCVFSA